MEKLNTLLALPPLTDLNISTVEVCDRPSNEWIPIIQNSIREAGLEIDADKDGVTTCENALRKFNATQSISLNNTASSRPLPKICSLEYCKRCFDGPECVNMAAGILYGGIKHECSVCYEKKQGGRSCMETCTAFYDPQRMLQTDGPNILLNLKQKLKCELKILFFSVLFKGHNIHATGSPSWLCSSN